MQRSRMIELQLSVSILEYCMGYRLSVYRDSFALSLVFSKNLNTANHLLNSGLAGTRILHPGLKAKRYKLPHISSLVCLLAKGEGCLKLVLQGLKRQHTH